MSEQLQNNTHQPERSVAEQLNADNANELSQEAFEQSGMSYMEWLDQGGYAGHVRREEAKQEDAQPEERNYKEARAATLESLAEEPDRVAEQVVTKSGDSWSYVRDDEGRKHRIGSQEASDLAQAHFHSLSEAEKAEISGGKHVSDNEAEVSDDIIEPQVSVDESNQEEFPVDQTATASSTPSVVDMEQGRSTSSAEVNNDETNESEGEDNDNTEQEPKRRSVWDDYRRKAVKGILGAKLAERLYKRWDAKAEQRDNVSSRRKKIAAGLAGLAFIGMAADGIVSGNSPEEVPRTPNVTAAPEDARPVLDDVEEVETNVEASEITVPAGSNVWNQVEKFVNNGDYLADEAPQQELVRRIVNAMEETYGELDVVQPGDTFEITPEILEKAGIDLAA